MALSEFEKKLKRINDPEQPLILTVPLKFSYLMIAD